MKVDQPLASFLPHGPAMVLLDSVESWNEREITCVARSHLRRDNPLRRGGKLATICGVEYAAQAAAVHGGLLGDPSPKAGLLASLRDVKQHVEHLDDALEALRVRTTLRHRDGRRIVYEFCVSAAERNLLTGQISIFFMDDAA